MILLKKEVSKLGRYKQSTQFCTILYPDNHMHMILISMLKRRAFSFPYAYIFHNKDFPQHHFKIGKKAVLSSRKYKRYKGKVIYKKPHYHFLWITENRRSEKSAGQFFGGLVNPNQVQICEDLQGYYNYMEHLDFVSRLQRKHPYPNKRKCFNDISSYIDIKSHDNTSLLFMRAHNALEDYCSLCVVIKRQPNLYDFSQYVISNCPECLTLISNKSFYFNTAIIGYFNSNMQYFITEQESIKKCIPMK